MDTTRMAPTVLFLELPCTKEENSFVSCHGDVGIFHGCPGLLKLVSTSLK